MRRADLPAVVPAKAGDYENIENNPMHSSRMIDTSEKVADHDPPTELDSPNHTRSSPSGARFLFCGVICRRDGNGEFDTSGKSLAFIHHPRGVRCSP